MIAGGVFQQVADPIPQYQNYDLQNVVTPIQTDILEDMLVKTAYSPSETKFLIEGFRSGFSLGYQGPKTRKDTSNNIPFTVGNHLEMWKKIMKEVQVGRMAGPFDQIPFENYVQSPIGLVPKAGNQTRLIFHLSYKFPNGNKSINYWTPAESCTVKYNDIDHTIGNCLHWIELAGEQFDRIYFLKTDLKSTFHVLPGHRDEYFLLILKANNPETNKIQYFVDKSMPFGASMSCHNFQRFSDALKHLVQELKGIRQTITNYLDDFLFLHYLRQICNELLRGFLEVCELIRFPVAIEKTMWATEIIEFLGVLLNGRKCTICIPADKVTKALNQIQQITHRKRTTIKTLQQVTGTLNFLTRAIVPGHTFTRRIYSKFAQKSFTSKGQLLKPYHHVKVDNELKNDCMVWEMFLTNQSMVNRPFIDVKEFSDTAIQLGFTTDASRAFELGFGCYYDKRWTFGCWEENFIENCDPSIAYLELYSLCVGIFVWQNEPTLQNCRVIVRCDNQATVQMVNNMTSSCPNCMYLLRLLAFNNLRHNRRIYVRYIDTKSNYLSDALSRMEFDRFFRLAPADVNPEPERLPEELWPISKIWQKLT